MLRRPGADLAPRAGGLPGWRWGMVPAAGCLCAALTLAACGGSPGGGPAGPGVWRPVSSGTLQPLNDVACLSRLRCEAVGAAGTIVATTDGGRTWRPQADPLQGSSSPLYRITCVAPSSCYVIARPDTILVTHDGGSSWSTHVLAIGVSGATLTDAPCLPDYAPIRGRLALCRLGLLDIACVNARTCYAVATTPPAYDLNRLPTPPPAAPSSIWMTGDGGKDWTSQPLPPGVACNGDCLSGLYPYPLVWVSCLGSGLCRAGGGHVLGCGHCGFAYAVLVNRGPGRSWACAQSAAQCATLSPDAADCPTRTVCYGLQSTNPFGPDIAVARSAGSGAGWVQIGDWKSSVLNQIACPAALTCYLTGSRGTIAEIANGARVISQRTPTKSDLYGIGCSGPLSCFAVGGNGTILALS